MRCVLMSPWYSLENKYGINKLQKIMKAVEAMNITSWAQVNYVK